MKRVVAFLAVVVLFVGGVAVGVNAQSDEHRSSPDAARLELTPINPDRLDEIHRLLTQTRKLKLQGNCPTGPLTIAKINCNLKELTKFAKQTDKHLNALDEFVETLFDCISYAPLTRYGNATLVPPVGYLFDPGTGVATPTTAIDSTHDTATEPFSQAFVVNPTAKCLDFLQ